MRTRINQDEFDLQLQRTISYFHGAFERELEVAARGIGISPSILTNGVAALLLGPAHGEILRPEDRVPGMSRTSPGIGEPMAALALAGGASSLGVPGDEGAESTTTASGKPRTRVAMSAEVKRKIGESTKKRWAIQKARNPDAVRLGHVTASGKPFNLKCEVCGETPPAGYQGQRAQKLWLSRHRAREHRPVVSKKYPATVIPGVRPGLEAKHAHVLRLRKQGLNREDIAKRVGISSSTIDRWMSAAHEPSRARSASSPYDESIRKRALQMAAKGGKSQAQMAKELGILPSAIYRWVHAEKAGRPTHTGGAWGGMTPEQRSAEMVRRRKVALQNRAARQAAVEHDAGEEPETDSEYRANGAMPEQLGT